MNKLLFVPLLVLSLFTCLPVARVLSVESTGIIEGTVEDSSGAVVAGVQLMVTNEQTGEAKDFTTATSGRFVFPNLQVGTYDLIAERAGVKKSVQVGIPLRVTEHLNLTVVLQVGEPASKVVVTAAATSVETKEVTVGKVIENNSLTDLPLNGRNYMQLTTLVPGSVPSVGYSEPGNPQIPGGVNATPQVNGGRLESNNFLLDGADNNEPFLGSPPPFPSPEPFHESK